MAVRRVCVVGNIASGKSRFTDRVVAALGLPSYSLDQLWWLPGWANVGRDEFLARQLEIVGREQWVIDGTYAEVGLAERFRAADAIVFMDVPGCARRAIARRGDGRTDLPDGVDDTELGLGLALAIFAELVFFNVLKRPRILAEARRCGKPFHRVRRWSDQDGVLAALAAT